MRIRLALHIVITLGVLVVCNALILQKHRIATHGDTMLLKLAPRDPRSLMQGDYMVLRYEIAAQIPSRDIGPERGTIVVQTNPQGIATFLRVHDGKPLGPGEHLLKYWRGRDGALSLGAESFFFQEGKAEQFARAQYGELKVALDGSSVLTGLRNEALESL